MKVPGLVGILLVMAACNNQAPTATTYKEQLGAPAAVTGNNNTGNATGGTGDATAGQAALAACTPCHVKGGIGHELVADDAKKITDGIAVTNPSHPDTLKEIFNNSGDDIAAYLLGGSASTPSPAPAAGTGDATAGAALLTTAGCEAACHAPGTGLELDANSNLDGQDQNPSHAAFAQYFTGKNKDDIQAALKAR